MCRDVIVAFRDPPSQQDRACVCRGQRKERGLLMNHPGSLVTKARTDRPAKDQKQTLKHHQHGQHSLIATTLIPLNQLLYKKHSPVLI